MAMFMCIEFPMLMCIQICAYKSSQELYDVFESQGTDAKKLHNYSEVTAIISEMVEPVFKSKSLVSRFLLCHVIFMEKKKNLCVTES